MQIPPRQEEKPSLLEAEPIPVRHTSPLEGRIALAVGGSAEEGVQQAAELFTRPAIGSGLEATNNRTGC